MFPYGTWTQSRRLRPTTYRYRSPELRSSLQSQTASLVEDLHRASLGQVSSWLDAHHSGRHLKSTRRQHGGVTCKARQDLVIFDIESRRSLNRRGDVRSAGHEASGLNSCKHSRESANQGTGTPNKQPIRRNRRSSPSCNFTPSAVFTACNCRDFSSSLCQKSTHTNPN